MKFGKIKLGKKGARKVAKLTKQASRYGAKQLDRAGYHVAAEGVRSAGGLGSKAIMGKHNRKEKRQHQHGSGRRRIRRRYRR